MSHEVYRNLRTGGWSIREAGRVVARADLVILTDATFVVQPAGRARVLRERAKNVHAFVRTRDGAVLWGSAPESAWVLSPLDELLRRQAERVNGPPTEVTYNPYLFDSFVTARSHRPVTAASRVRLDPDGRAWAWGLTYKENDA